MRLAAIGLCVLLFIATLTGRSGAACVGDCNGDGDVTIDEIIKGVAVALGASIEVCRPLDANGDGEITIDELIRAVNNALNSCPVSDTPTPTTTMALATPTPSPTEAILLPSATASATATPSQLPTATIPVAVTVAHRAAGLLDTLTSVFRSIPKLMSVLTNLNQSLAPRSTTAEVERTFQCPGSGGGTISCDRPALGGVPPRFGPPTFTILLDQCVTTADTGGNLKFDGLMTLQGQNGDGCTSLPDVVTLGIDELTIDATGGRGSVRAEFTGFSAVTTFACANEPCACKADSIGLELAGKVVVTATVGDTQVPDVNTTFDDGSSILLEVSQYSDACSPVKYHMSVNGDIEIATQGASFVASFAETDLNGDSSTGQDLVSIEGSVESPCLGSSISYRTQQPMAFSDAAVCPVAGGILVNHDAASDLLAYANQGVSIDLNDDQSFDGTFESCLDPSFFVCVESN